MHAGLAGDREKNRMKNRQPAYSGEHTPALVDYNDIYTARRQRKAQKTQKRRGEKNTNEYDEEKRYTFLCIIGGGPIRLEEAQASPKEEKGRLGEAQIFHKIL